MDSVFTLEQAEHLIAASQPSSRRGLVRGALLLAGVVLMVVIAISRESIPGPPWVAVLVPWLMVGTLMATRWVAVRRTVRLVDVLTRAGAEAERNNWAVAGGLVAPLLERPIHSTSARAQALLLYAGAAERARQHEVSERVLEIVLLEHIGEPVQLHQAVVGLAAVKLRTSQLTDAVNILDRMRRAELPPSLQAGLELVRLFQEVLMGHHDDAAGTLTERRALFRRHLSTRAGYGYALLAAALDGVGRKVEAAELWRDATLLIPPATLVERYDLLGPLAQRYAAAEWPV